MGPIDRSLQSYDELLRKTRTLIRDATSSTTTTTKADECYNTLEAWIKVAEDSSDLRAAHYAESLLAALEGNLQRRIRTVFVPKQSYYEVVLQAYAVSKGKRQAAESAENVLDRMIALCKDYVDNSESEGSGVSPCEPSIKAWNIAINCWAKSGDLESGRRAESILKKMEDWKSFCNAHRLIAKDFPYSGCLPTERTVTGVLDAWSRSRHRHAPENASKLLHSVIESQRIGEARYKDVKLDAAVFNSCITTWTRSGRGREAATKAEEIMQVMNNLNETGDWKYNVYPNSRTYTMVLDAWARCEGVEHTGHAAHRAEQILNNMIRLYEEGYPIKPNTIAFTSCISAWARCQSLEAPERAQLLLSRLVRLFEDTGDNDFKPDNHCANAVVTSWARATQRQDSVEQAFAALRQVEEYCSIDLSGYAALLNALHAKGMADEALDLLKKLEDAGGKLAPTATEYNIVLNALAKCDRPAEADSLLRKMDRLAHAGRPKVKPDNRSYTILLDAWARCMHDDALLCTHNVLQEMITRYRTGDLQMKPDYLTFSVLMKACLKSLATREERRKAIDMALTAFHTDAYGELNHTSYALLLHVIVKQVDDLEERNKLLMEVFGRCRDEGMVSSDVYTTLRRHIDALLELDDKCSRNVPRKDWPMS